MGKNFIDSNPVSIELINLENEKGILVRGVFLDDSEGRDEIRFIGEYFPEGNFKGFLPYVDKTLKLCWYHRCTCDSRVLDVLPFLQKNVLVSLMERHYERLKK